MDTEILVHVAAPGRVQDDTRYRAIAAGVLGFRPATRIAPGGRDSHEDSGGVPSISARSDVEVLSSPADAPRFRRRPITCGGHDAMTATNKRKRDSLLSNSSSHTSKITDSFALPRLKQDKKQSLDSHGSFVQASRQLVSNGDVHSIRKTSMVESEHAGYAESNIAAATTTPAQVLVPFTEQRLRQLTPTHAHPSNSSMTTVPNSRPAYILKTQPPTRDQCTTQVETSSQEVQSEAVAVTSQLQPGKYRGSVTKTKQGTLDIKQVVVTTADVDLGYPSSLIDVNLRMNTVAPGSGHLTASLPRVFPSAETSTRARTSSQVVRTTRAVQALEWKVDAPSSTNRQQSFDTVLTRRLSELEQAMPIKEHFWPITVTRDIKVLARGYWSIPITIADHTEVDKWRQMNTFSRSDPVRVKYTHSPWTAGEFFAFYNRLTDGIRHNQFGRVSLFKVDSDAEKFATIKGTVRTALRLYSWGEVVAHLYIAMCWASDSLIEYLPLEWVGSDGTTVVKMAGEKCRWKIARSGQWTDKGGEREGRKYGLTAQV